MDLLEIVGVEAGRNLLGVNVIEAEAPQDLLDPLRRLHLRVILGFDVVEVSSLTAATMLILEMTANANDVGDPVPEEDLDGSSKDLEVLSPILVRSTRSVQKQG